MKALQYLNKYFVKYRKLLILGTVLTVVARLFALQVPRLIGNSLEAVELHIKQAHDTGGSIQRTLVLNILIIIGAAIISGAFTFLMRQTIINVSRFIEFDLKNEIFSQYLKLNQRFYKNHRTGDLMSRISEDVSKARMYFGPALMYGINTITLFAVVITYMFSVAPELSAYTIIPLPILSILVYRLSKLINVRSAKVQVMLSKMSAFSQEIFSGISVIKSYNIQKTMGSKFDALTKENYAKNMNLAEVQAWFFPLVLLLIGFSNLIVIFIGGKRYIDGLIDIGTLAEFVIYVNLLTWPVALVGWITSIVQQAEASQERINDFLKQESEIRDGHQKIITKNLSIKFRNVSVYYSETKIQALDKISFELKAGQTLGIIGGVGTGKTTILDLISRLYDPTEGVVEIGGVDIKKLKVSELRNLVGYVPQYSFLFSDTIEENIRFGKYHATDQEIKQAAQNAVVSANIEGFNDGYQTLLGERGVTLSGGQMQRISIARALIKNPEVLLLDDCLSAVDSETEEIILDNLKRLRKNKTTIIVSHRISAIENADEIIVLEGGKIIEHGDHKKLLSLGRYYYRIHQKQNA